MPDREDRLLIYAPVPLFNHGGTLFVEDQALIGLRHWTRNFGHVDAMLPVENARPPRGWSPATALDDIPNLDLHHLPTAYRPDQFLRALPRTRARIRTLIDRNTYVSFAIGGLFGDWGAVGALTASGMGRDFAVWTDRVESEVTRQAMHAGPWKARLRARLYHRPMALLERTVIRRATVGLFHGRETYDHYSPYARQSVVMHNILVDRADHIDAATLAQKQAQVAGGGPLKLVYAGRADAMKGPLDWVEILARLKARGVAFTATWLGDGAQLGQMRDALGRHGLTDQVDLPGFVTDRARVLREMREAHVFLFCHKTPESPRCLIEALISGTPVVGYDGAYARDLIQNDRGGVLRPIGDVEAVAGAVAALDADRAGLAALMSAAYGCGKGFDVDSLYRDRAAVIRQHLGDGDSNGAAEGRLHPDECR